MQLIPLASFGKRQAVLGLESATYEVASAEGPKWHREFIGDNQQHCSLASSVFKTGEES